MLTLWRFIAISIFLVACKIMQNKNVVSPQSQVPRTFPSFCLQVLYYCSVAYVYIVEKNLEAFNIYVLVG